MKRVYGVFRAASILFPVARHAISTAKKVAQGSSPVGFLIYHARFAGEDACATLILVK